MKTRLNRMIAKSRQKRPDLWVAKAKQWRYIDETKPLEPAPVASGWVVLMVEPRMEGKAATALRDAGYVAWFPQTVEETKNEKRKVRRKVNRPLFPRYLFAAVPVAAGWLSEGDGYGGSGNPALKALARLCGPAIGMGDCDHVTVIVGPVPSALLANLSDRQCEGEFEQREIISQFGKNSRVRITEGPFAGLDGIVHRSQGRRVEVLMSFLGSERRIPLDASQVVAA